MADNFYFKHLPDVWIRMGPAEGTRQPFIKVKNMFRNVALVNNLQKEFLLFSPITIEEGDRPDKIAFQYYGDPAYDWIVLLCNQITNVYAQWPLNQNEMWEYIQFHYPDIDTLSSIHHYETNEVKLDNGVVILPPGIIVNENFTYRDPETHIQLTGLTIRHPVTIYEHIVKENDEKREIYLLKKSYLGQFISEFEKLIEYDDDVVLEDEAPITKTSLAGNYLTK